MSLSFVLLLLGLAGLWLAIRQFRDFRRRVRDFSEWMVSDATPLNRRLWLVNAWVRLIALFVGSAACLFGAYQSMLGN